MQTAAASLPASPARPGTAGRPRAGAARAERKAARERRRREDVRLVQAVLDGDEAAFRTLVERYQRPVYWIAHDILLDGEEARDVVQETFIRVHSALERFDQTRDFVNWLYRIARNLAIDALRRRRRRPLPAEDLTHLPLDAGGPDRGASDVAQHVREVLAELPVAYRLALSLRELQGLSPREIARVTDCTYPTARWRLHRARALFRDAWQKRFGAGAAEEARP